MLGLADKKSNGLTLISAATGKGKTYEVINYAVGSLNSGRYKRVVFIEPRHSILKEVKEKIEKKDENFKIIYLKSAVENAKDYIESININSINDKVAKEEVGIIKNLLNGISNSEKLDKTLKETIEKDVFRVKSELKEYCIKNKKLLQSDLEEIKKIFPENIKQGFQFILMTMDKLFYSLDTLENNDRILSNNIFNEDTLVIIDELDKCYGVALNKSAENKDTLDDMISLIQSAYKFISKSDTRWQTINNEEENNKIENSRKELISEIDELQKEYGILNNFIFKNKDEEKIELFVSRRQSFVAGKDQNYKLTIKGNTTILERSPEKTEFSVVKMAVACKQVIRKILNLIYVLCDGYMKDRDDATYEDGLLYGISQVLNRTTSESGHYLNYARNNSIKTQSLRIANNEYVNEKSVCNNGFSHCIFENRPGTNHTYITSVGIDLTPENIFVWLCKHSNVLGLSATQQIPTTLTLDLDYMKEVLEDKFDYYSREDFFNANKNIEQKTQNLHCDVIKSFGEDESKLAECIKQILIEEGRYIPDRLEDAVSRYVACVRKKSDSNLIDREFKRFFAINEFLLRKDAISGIVILNSYFDRISGLDEYIDDIKNKCGIETIDKDNIYQVSASNIEQEIDGIKDKLNAGDKCLIISNKEALGQGVNIHYNRDFNFFYQEEPTYIYPVIKKEQILKKEEINKYIYLVMKMASNGEINDAHMKAWVTSIVNNNPWPFKNCTSVKNAKTSIFIQGLGRANRNSDKEEHEYIYFDEDLCDSLQLEDAQVEKTQELLAVEEKIKQYQENRKFNLQNNMNNYERELCDKSNRLQSHVEELLNIFTNNNMETDRDVALKKYNKLRDTLYEYGLWPKIIKKEDEEAFEELGYVKVQDPVDTMYYISEDDKYCENLLAVSLKQSSKFKELSFKTVLNIKNYKKPEGECWMINPKAFNLLQGIVGEKKFKEVFEENTQIELEELPLEENEIYGDFRVKNTDVFIDVKNFSEEGGTRDITEFAIDKLKKIKEHNPDGMLIIVNVFAKEKYANPNSDSKDIFIISNVIGEHNIKELKNIRKIEEWIDQNT
jgi:hypothetical protein